MREIVPLLAELLYHLSYGKDDPCLSQLHLQRYLERYPGYVRDWATTIETREPSQVTLLYRHHLTRLVMQEEIYPQWDRSILPLVAAALYTRQPHFTPLPTTGVWSQLTPAPNVINTLRHLRPSLQHHHLDLADRLDVTDAQLVRDHGLLSSFLLVYGLYLIYVHLDFEHGLRPTDETARILRGVTYTLTELKGVLFHGETRWLCPHVR